jgi:hypothetical protein
MTESKAVKGKFADAIIPQTDDGINATDNN